MSSGVSWILNAAGRYPLLTHEEELIYGRQVQRWLEVRDSEDPMTPERRRIERTGKRAFDKMFSCNLRLVINVAKKYAWNLKHLTMEDLVQEGSIGLKRAVEKFDPARGYKFSTYSFWWIRQAITRAIDMYERPIRMAGQSGDTLRKLKGFIPDFYREHRRLPTMQESADYCGVKTIESMEAVYQHLAGCVSLDSRGNDKTDEHSAMVDLIACDRATPWEAAELEDSVRILSDAFPKLGPQEQKLVSCVWGLNGETPKSIRQISDELGKHRENVRFAHRKALTRLKQYAYAGYAA